MPPPELDIEAMTSEGELNFKFNQEMTVLDLDFEEMLSFTVKAAADNSLRKAVFVKDAEEVASKKRRLLWIKDEKPKVIDKAFLNEYAKELIEQADKDYEKVWPKAKKVPSKADDLSCFWYVESQSPTEIKFKFEFDKPDSVSSGSYGSDQVIVKIKNLD